MKINKYLHPLNYMRYFMNLVNNLFSPYIKSWENVHIRKYAKQPLKHQPVFIIGAPRTGSTILYQAITNQFDTLFFNNLNCIFYKNIFFGTWLSDKCFKNKAHNCSHAIHGSTSNCGLKAPSECGSFWYRWLPTHRHYLEETDLTDKMVTEIREEITSIINYFDKPFVFKNLNCGQRLKLIAKCFPDAKLIYIKRQPLYTAQSILIAKRELNLRDNTFWSVMPPNVKELKRLDGYTQIIHQIYYIEKQIESDKKLFSTDSLIEIKYSDMDNMDEILDQIKQFIILLERKNYKKIIPKVKENQKLSSEEFKKLKSIVSQLDWTL